ncbi:MAG: hypothetical protein ACI81L_000829 [Verrucomicrobiales bacterium]|jgi:hypothetical protein
MASMTHRIAPLVLAMSLVVVLVSSTPARAQGAGSLELVAQSAWVDDGGIFDIQVRVAGADPQASVVVRVYPPWPQRDDFLRQDLPEDAEPVLELEPVILGDVQGTSNEVLGFQLAVGGTDDALADSDADPDGPAPLDLLVTEGGSAVHPLEVSLYDPDGNLADRFLTSLIELPRGTRSAPLRTAIVLEIHLPPTPSPNSETLIDSAALHDFGVILDAIQQNPDADVALSISPESLASIARSNAPEADLILERIREHLDPDQLLPNPYAEVEEQAWVDTELGDELIGLYNAGALAMQSLVGFEPEPAVMLLDRTLNAEGLEALTSFGVRGVIVRPAQLEPLDKELFPQSLTTRFLIPTPNDGAVPALVADRGLANHFTNEGTASYNANRLLADLTMLSLQNSDVRQAVVVNPPIEWVPDASFLNVLLSGIERIPAIRAASPLDALSDTAFAPGRGTGTLSPPLRRELKPFRTPDSLRSFRTEYSQAQAAINSWSAVIAADPVSGTRLQELLHVSTDYRLTKMQRSAYIDAIYTLINDQKDGSITTPASDTITLTGRISEVPIIVENNLAVDVSVVLLLDSEKLDFPEGREIFVTLRPGANRIEIPIEARASGDSPIRIQVFSPDRSVPLGSSEVLVRTFAFSGVGLVIGVIAIIVLLLWWLRHLRSTRDTIEPLPDSLETTEAEDPIGVPT